MDPAHVWKDDYRREVEEVLAARRRARARGEPVDAAALAPGQRLSDYVIPPASVHADLGMARERLDILDGECRELRGALKAAGAEAELERERRERIKDAAAKLAFEARGLQGQIAAARERLARTDDRILASRLERDEAYARLEESERALSEKNRFLVEFKNRLGLLETAIDTKDSEIFALKERLRSAMDRAQQVSALTVQLGEERHLREIAQQRLDSDVNARLSTLIADERTAMELRTHEVERALARAQEIEKGFQIVVEDSELRANAAEIRAQEAEQRVAEIQELIEMHSQRTEAAEAKQIQAESRLHSSHDAVRPLEEALRRSESERDLSREAAARLRGRNERVRKRFARLASAIKDLRARGAAERENSTKLLAAARDAEASAAARAEDAEERLSVTLSAHKDLTGKLHDTQLALVTYRDRIQELGERLRIASANPDVVINELLESKSNEAQALRRVEAEASLRDAMLEEERANMRADFEVQRGKLEDEISRQRAQFQARLQEQVQLLEDIMRRRGE